MQETPYSRTQGISVYFIDIQNTDKSIQMLHYETIEPDTLELLKRLQSQPCLKSTRLVGGTALALQLGHRKSVDLDLFGTIECDAEELKEAISSCGATIALKESANIHIYSVDGIKVDIVNYKYPWLDDAIAEDGVVLAKLPDIASMKVNAIIGRGTRKDFVDLANLMKHYSLSQILNFYFRKYPEASMFLAAKSMAYFADAENDPMPYMFTKDTWDDIKTYISKQYEAYGESL